MCGIFGYVGLRKDAGNIVYEGLKMLEYRGYDSWGLGIGGDHVVHLIKDIGKIGDKKKSFLTSHIAFGHTRWATHGNVTKQNAHPHLDCSKRYAIIHNGVIENYASLKGDLLKKGHVFASGTDTEVAIHLIEEFRKNENSLREAVRSAFQLFEGLNAIIVLDSKNETFVAAKNGSPLVIGKGGNEYFIASDVPAFIPYTQEVNFMEDVELIEITEDKMNVFTISTGEKKVPVFEKLNWHFDMASRGTYSHFMLKEIHEQPTVLRTILESNETNISDLASLIQHAFGTYFVACGSAAYAAHVGTYLFSKIAKRHVNFGIGSEFGYLLDFLTEKSLVIALSQSGETIDVIDPVKRAKEKNATIATLVNNLGSTLYRMADYKMLLCAGPEKAVASTKAFTAKLAFLLLLAYQVAGQLSHGKKQLALAIQAVESLLANEDDIRQLAKKIVSAKHIFTLGRGSHYPVALEAALKIKEVSYIHAEGFAGGELKHGPIALVEKGTPCIVFLPNNETYGVQLVGAMEMKARGGFIIGVSTENHEIFDHHISLEDSSEAAIIPHAVVGQLLGYFLAIEKGIDPDKPRNLAKSVTVK